MKTSIIVRSAVKGIHRFEQAQAPVEYLCQDHRHIFNIETKIEVFHDDRELEFLTVQGLITDYFADNFEANNDTYDFGTLSCEQIAKALLSEIECTYGSFRAVSVGVFEDNENGALVERTLEECHGN